jgi:pyruvate-formate lyase-activating enzyme
MKEHKGCFLPLNALALHPHGERKFCLTSNLPSVKNTEEFDTQRMNIHKELLNNEWPSSCKSCKFKENQNIQSRRTRTWERKVSRYGEDEAVEMLYKQEKPYIRHLEITFSNLCNITCAMCSSEFSSSWLKLDKKALDSGLSFREFTRPYQSINRMSQEMMEEILSHASEFDLVIIKGGEPTIEPLCLEFLQKLGKLNLPNDPLVFIQTNGTRDPSEWLPYTKGLKLEVGFSLDGWGQVGDWIRGTDFNQVLKNFRTVAQYPSVQEVTVDFTFSLFNCFHLSDFFEKMLELKSEIPKLRECAVFQWVQQFYASPLSLTLESRLKVREQVSLIFDKDPSFFLNYENLLKVLELPRLPEASVETAKKWTKFMNESRGFSIFDLQPELISALEIQT